MTKHKELTTNGCLGKAANDEMLFVLRAQDFTAPKTVLYWISENFEGTPEEKLREAFECALQMRNHKKRKQPD